MSKVIEALVGKNQDGHLDAFFLGEDGDEQTHGFVGATHASPCLGARGGTGSFRGNDRF